MRTTNLLRPIHKEGIGHTISITVRRVNDVANKLQAQQKWPILVKDLHAEVLEAVQKKQTHVDIDWAQWQSIVSLTK